MKHLKLISAFVGGLLIILGLSCMLWYNYSSLKLSFFISTDTPAVVEIDAEYTNYENKDFIQPMHISASTEPTLYSHQLKTAQLDRLKLTFRGYKGTVNLADVYISGHHFGNFTIAPSDGLNVLNNSPDNISFMMQNDTAVTICTACVQQTQKHFKPLIFTAVILAYLFFCALTAVGYIFRTKIKEKLLTLYTFKNYARIFPYAKPYWFRALLAIVITLPVGAMDAVIAWSLKPFMDVVLVEKQTGWTMYIPLMIVFFSILQALFTYIATYMNTWVGNKISLDVKRRLFNKLLHNDAEFFDKENSGNVLFRFNADAENACGSLMNNMKLFFTRFFSSISLIIVLFYNSWQLAIVAVIVMFGALYPLTRVRKRLKKVITKDANIMATIMHCYNETFSGNRIITAYNLYDYCKQRFVEAVNNMFDLTLQMIRKTGIISPIMHVISSFGIAFVIWYGSYLIVSHQITVGNFASFITSLVMLYNPIKSIGNNFNGVIMSLMAVDRVFQKLNEPNRITEVPNAEKLEHCHGDICYKNVSFAYQKDKPVLKNINLDIKAGQTIALVGNSGGGKTTISSLLPRFYDIQSGQITIDGKDIKQLSLESLRNNIAIVFQDNFLFCGTIRENILLGRTDVSDEELNRAIRGACLEEFINSLDNGLETQIGERGVMLSGGQKQRLAIARAFIKNAPILILDEATSALDNKSEAVVQQAIDNLMQERTVLVIAHRLSTVRNADCIVVINNGEIVEQGSHEELLKQEGAYAALYKTQLS